MDFNASAPYEFLDLSDIDDSERKKLIYTLYKTTSSQEESTATSLNDNKKSHNNNTKRSTHGTTSAAIKEFNKYSRYESSKYVKNIAGYNLPQQLTQNEHSSAAHVVRNLVIPRFITPIAFPFCALVRPSIPEVAVVPLRTPSSLTASAAVKTHVAEQTKGKVNCLPGGSSNINSIMAQHSPALHHQHQQHQHQHQQQQQQQSQQQIVSTHQSQQVQQQSSTQNNNNINNYPPQHPAQQTHTFNQIPPGGVFMPHGVSPVGGAMYLPCPVPAPLPGNVYVNNVTANVNLHGYVAHSVPQYIPGTASAFMPGEVQQNMTHVTEQQNTQQMIQQQQPSNITSSRGGNRRGRGRGSGGNSRRNDYNQRQQQVSPAPAEVVNTGVDTSAVGTTAYQPYYQYAYPQPFFGAPAQNIGHPQAQQATGAPLYVAASHVPMFPGPQVYNYPQIIYPATMLAPEYQLIDEKGEEQSQSEGGIIQHVWPGTIPMEYPEEYMNPELVEDVNHNPSPLTSSDTPSMLSPSYSIYESQMHSTVEIQQQMNTLHIYDTQQQLQQQQQQQQHMQAEEQQIQDCQSLQVIPPPIPIQLGTPALQSVPLETAIIEQPILDQSLDNANNNNNEDVLNEVPPIAISVEQNVQASPSNFVNNNNNITSIHQESGTINEMNVNIVNPVNSSNGAITTSFINQSVPSIQSSKEEKNYTLKSDNENQYVPTSIENDNSVQNQNKTIPQPWSNQNKKTTASVAVTATPSANKQQQSSTAAAAVSVKNIVANVNPSIPQTPQPTLVKNYGVMKTPSSPIATNESSSIDKKNALQPTVEIVKSISTASIASTVVPHQLQDIKMTTIQANKAEVTTSVTATTKDNSPKQDTEMKVRKDEATSTVGSVNSAPVQQTPPSWASLFSNKANVNISSSSISTISTPNSNILKKPVAKVFPFEGTTNFTPPTTPGNMSYSAASAQGISASQSTTTGSGSKTKNSSTSSTVSNIPKETADEWTLKFSDFLTKYKIDYSSVSLRPRGLTNRSNYCYINAILQALAGCPPFYNLIKSIPKQPAAMINEKTNTPTINAMIQMITEFSHLPPGVRLNHRREKGQKKEDLSNELQCDPAFEPTAIYKLWNSTRADVEGRQEDAEEFLGYVLNKLNDEMLEVIKLIAKPNSEQNGDSNLEADDGGEDWQMIYNNRNKGSVTRQTDFGRTPLSDIFRGELRSRIQREGELSTDVIQPFFTLQLNIEKAASVKEALEILVGRDQLEGVTCSKTNQEVVAWQQMTLEKLPVVLILHLKWFDYKLDGCTKILKTVEFPVELRIDAKILANKKYSQKQRLYRLFAVVYHDGKEASKGHYITDVYHPGYMNWLRYDDSSVKPISEHNVLRPRAPRVPYLLYYRRCDTYVHK